MMRVFMTERLVEDLFKMKLSPPMQHWLLNFTMLLFAAGNELEMMNS